MFKAVVTFIALAFSAADPANAENILVKGLDELDTEIVYEFPDDANRWFYRASTQEIALWVRRNETVDVAISNVGLATITGYRVEGLGQGSSTYFAQPAGAEADVAQLGNDLTGTFIYWAPEAVEGMRDFSGNLVWSPDGSTVSYVTNQNGKDYIHFGAAKFGPYNQIFGRILTHSNDLIYSAFDADGTFRVFLNGEALSDGIADIRRVSFRTGKNGSGYLYAAIRESGLWMTFNGQIIENSDRPIDFSISDNGLSYGYSREIDGKFETVINGQPSGHLFDNMVSIVFSSDGRQYAVFARRGENDEVENFFEVNGSLIGPFNGEPMGLYHFAESGEFVHAFEHDGLDRFYFGETQIGSFEPGTHFNPKSLGVAGNYYIPFKIEQAPGALTADGRLQYEPTDDIRYLFQDSSGDIHATINRGDVSLRLFNDEVVGEYQAVAGERSASDETAFIGVRDEMAGIYQNEELVIEAATIDVMELSTSPTGTVLVATIKKADGEYLLYDRTLYGPAEEILLDDVPFMRPGSAFNFFSRTGQAVRRHQLIP